MLTYADAYSVLNSKLILEPKTLFVVVGTHTPLPPCNNVVR